MDVREKLVELLLQEQDVCEPSDCKYCGVKGSCGYYRTADRLIANGVTVHEWIPVKERLPESGEWVLCACRANIIEVLKYDSKMDDWDSTMPERCYMKGFVTNWMPLPQPPKGE